MPAGKNNTQGWHEDFGDEPSVEERILEGWNFEDTFLEDDDFDDFDDDDGEYDAELVFDDDDGEYDAELVIDRKADEYFNHYDYGDYGGEG